MIFPWKYPGYVEDIPIQFPLSYDIPMEIAGDGWKSPGVFHTFSSCTCPLASVLKRFCGREAATAAFTALCRSPGVGVNQGFFSLCSYGHLLVISGYFYGIIHSINGGISRISWTFQNWLQLWPFTSYNWL